MLMWGSMTVSTLARRTLMALAAAAGLAFPLAAIAWQGPGWNSGLRWTDGREVQWRVSPAPGWDGSNVELGVLNNSCNDEGDHLHLRPRIVPVDHP